MLSHAQRVADEFRDHTGVTVDAGELLTGRAALLGLAPDGRISAGGATRLLPARDGWCALTLSRPDDVDAVPALVEVDASPPTRGRPSQQWAAARPPPRSSSGPGCWACRQRSSARRPPPRRVIQRVGAGRAPRPWPGLLVVDLSSMWAGPLCGQLLAQAGATVVKVESPARPDGTRAGPSAFFDWMNAGKLSYATDFDNPGPTADPARRG